MFMAPPLASTPADRFARIMEVLISGEN